MNEHDICTTLSALLPTGRENECFASDAEIFQFNGARALFSTDEFSEEDMFPDEPELLGWNIAVATMSDVFACGGTPLFYAHALTVSPDWDLLFIESFARGVAAALRQSGARFLGGDVGRSRCWRCTGSVIGASPRQAVTRIGARPGDLLYLSGPIGLGNAYAAAALHGHTTLEQTARFSIRTAEARLVAEFASACIDTSDGLRVALNTLADLNQTGFAVADVPHLPFAADTLRTFRLPPVLLAMAECGEYELLFTVPPEREPRMQYAADALGCSPVRIGAVRQEERSFGDGEAVYDLQQARISARDFESPAAYFQALVRNLAECSLAQH